MLKSSIQISGRCIVLILLLFFTTGWDVWNVDLVGEVYAPHSAWSLVIVEEFVYLADGSSLRVYDISVPEEPDEIEVFEINAMRVYSLDDFLIVSLQNGGITLYDISDPESPEHLSTFPNSLIFRSPAIYQDYLYIACQRPQTRGIFILDISDPENPDSVGFIEWESILGDLVIRDDMFYITSFGGFSVYQLEEPLEPDSITTIDTLSRSSICRIVDNAAYIAGYITSYSGTMWVIDISDPEELELLGRSNVNGSICDMVIDDSLSYIAGSINGLRIWDLHDLNNIEEIGWYHLPRRSPNDGMTKTWSLDVVDGIIYLAYCARGMKICDFNERGSTVLITPDHFEFPTLQANEHEQRTVLLRNQGHIDQLVTEIQPHEGIFSVDLNDELLLEPYEEVELTLIYEPEEPGEFYDTLSLTVEDYDPPPPVTIFGSCTEMEEVYQEDLFSYVTYFDIDEEFCYVAGGRNNGTNFSLMDVNDPEDPQILDSLRIMGFSAPDFFHLHDDHLYAALYEWMDWNLYAHAVIAVERDDDEFGRVGLIDIEPMRLGEWDDFESVHRTDRYFIVCASPGMYVIDYQEDDFAMNEDWHMGYGGIEQLGEYFCSGSYVNQEYEIVLFDLENINDPEIISTTEVVPRINDIAIANDYVFVAADDLYIFDFCDPEEPELIDILHTPGNARHMDIVGDVLYLADGTSVRTYNIMEPEHTILEAVNYIPSVLVAGRDDHLFTFSADGNLWIYDMSEIIDNFERFRDIEIDLDEGWNMISINVTPPEELWEREEGPDIILMTEQLKIDEENHHIVLLKDKEGRFYWPEFGYNGIPFWNLTEGFQVIVDEDIVVVWSGEPIAADADIPLTEGWNLIAYYPRYELSAASPDYYVLSPIIEQLIIAKDEAGRFMWLRYNYSNMPAWREGEGYHVKVEEDVVLNYPIEQDDRIMFAGLQEKIENHWTVPTPTGRNMNILVTAVSGYDCQIGDQIAVFSSTDYLIGTGIIDRDGLCGLAVWGDDPTTDVIDGAVNVEQLSFRLWNGTSEMELRTEWIEGDSTYMTNGLSAVSLSTQSTLPLSFGLEGAYPNPFNPVTTISYQLPEPSLVSIRIYDIQGREITTLVDGEVKAGFHRTIWNGTEMPSGLYFVRLKASNRIFTQKVMLIK
ncbi:MAG: T9SS type A sorting domain-containing protein [Calditrichaeota bacterium]|nr:T9SS type A sorting domain-containing protein [Calditrichota bacterium]